MAAENAVQRALLKVLAYKEAKSMAKLQAQTKSDRSEGPPSKKFSAERDTEVPESSVSPVKIFDDAKTKGRKERST